MPTDHVRLSTDDATDLGAQVLEASRTRGDTARIVASALVAAEVDGHRGHGLSRLPSYALHARCGKVDGHASPRLHQSTPGLVLVDAAGGFAYPALRLATDATVERVRRLGIAGAAVGHSHHAGVAGHHVEAIARQGLVAVLVANTPAAMAPWGGRRPIFGTNPIAFAAPRAGDDPIVIDLSLTRVARGRIVQAGREGRPLEPGWAIDADGRPTTDPEAALAGSLLPAGEAKGAALALVVELLAAGLSGSHFGSEASSFFDETGGPPEVGQFLLAIDPGPTSSGTFADRVAELAGEIEREDGCRVPGTSRRVHRERASRDGVLLPRELHDQLTTLATTGTD